MIPPEVMEQYGIHPYTFTPVTQKDCPAVLIAAADVNPLLKLLGEIPLGHPVAVDTETTGLYPYEGDVIRGISLAWRLDGDIHQFYIPVGYPLAWNNLSETNIRLIFNRLKSRDPFLVFHHGKFDLRFLRQLPMDTDGSIFFPWPAADQWWDCKVVAWLLDENMSNSLDAQAEYHFGEHKIDMKPIIKQRGGWDKIQPEDTAEYAARDAALTLRLYYRQQELVDEAGVRPAIERELAINGVLFRMEQNGILIDQERLAELTEAARKGIAEIEVGFDINLRSPQQVARRLYDELGLGDGKTRSTAKATLERLHDESGTVDLILKHRRLQKALSGYLESIPNRIGLDGRMHPTFWSMGTVTGRFSCSDPNLQTIPRADTLPGVRDIFIPEEGYELWEYDLQAAEKRVMAGMADETVLIEMLESGADVHAHLARQVFGDDFTGLQRRFAKNIGYGFDYGLTNVKTAAKYIQAPDAEQLAAKILTGLRKTYPRIVKLMNRSTREAQRDGRTPLGDAWPGRFRHYDTPRHLVSKDKKPPAPFTALNFKVQGGIGELMKDVMASAEHHLGNLGARPCLQVHDSLVIEVPDGKGELVLNLLQMTLDDLNPFAMPMIFDGKPWGDHD